MVEVLVPDVIDTHSQEFEQVFRQYSKFLYRIAYGVTGNAEDAEDVLQTVFARFFANVQRNPRIKDNPRAYLYRAVVNASLNIIKVRRRMEPIDSEMLLEGPIRIREALADHIRERVLAALDTLAESNAPAVELLILRYFDNQSDAAIAKALGQSRGAIALRLHRARARLKKLLKDLLRDPKK
jgi:RNA polymerase sigma-70 factor (ECF subfamily)